MIHNIKRVILYQLVVPIKPAGNHHTQTLARPTQNHLFISSTSTGTKTPHPVANRAGTLYTLIMNTVSIIIVGDIESP